MNMACRHVLSLKFRIGKLKKANPKGRAMLGDWGIHWLFDVVFTLFCIVLFNRSDKKKRLQREELSINLTSTLCTEEVKGLQRHRIYRSLKIYANGYEKAMYIDPGRYGCSITRQQFKECDLHVCHEGYWVKKFYNPDGSIKEKIDLMPTLHLPPLPPEPAQIPRRDYGKAVATQRWL